MAYVLFFLRVLWYTLGALVICGSAVALCRRLFLSMMGQGFGRRVVLVTSVLGTPVHELGHALMCCLFGHRITAMSLWQPRSSDGKLGYVTHAYSKKNPYHVLGNLFIGVGPIFSGLGVLALAMLLGFPQTLSEYTEAALRATASGEGSPALLLEGMKLLPHMLRELAFGEVVPLWGRAIALVVILAVSQHVSLSPADIKGALTSLPIYLVLTLLLTGACGLLGQEAMETVLRAFALFSAYLTALFVPVLVGSCFQLVIAFPFWLIRRLCKA